MGHSEQEHHPGSQSREPSLSTRPAAGIDRHASSHRDGIDHSRSDEEATVDSPSLFYEESSRPRRDSNAAHYQHTNARRESIATQNRGEGFSYETVRYHGHPRDLHRPRAASHDYSVSSHHPNRDGSHEAAPPPTHIGAPRCYDAAVGDDFDIPFNPETLYDNIGSFNTYAGKRIPRTKAFVPQEPIKDSGATYRFYKDIADSLADRSRRSSHSYYRFDPSSGGHAHYMYKNEDGSGYRRDSVSLKLVPNDSGDPSYQIDVSQKDPAISELPEAMSDKAQHLHDPNTGSGAQKEPTRFKDRPGRKKSLQKDSSDQERDDGGKRKDMFLVSEGDIADIVKATVGEVQRLWGEKTPEAPRAEKSESSCRPWVDGRRKSIAVPRGEPAYPATTVNSSSISFTPSSDAGPLSRGHKKVVEYDGSNKATVISLPSVAEYTWVQRDALDQEGASLGTMTTTTRGGRRRRPTQKDESNQITELSSPATVGKEKVYLSSFAMNQQGDRDHGGDNTCDGSYKWPAEVTMTSFPGLLSRNSTNDWLNPPVEIELSRRYSTDLFDQGVDAHSGTVTYITSSENEPTKPRHCNRTLFNEPFFSLESEEDGARRPTVTSSSSRERAVGSSVGVSSHKRKSSAAIRQPMETHPPVVPTLMSKIQRGGKRLLHKLSDNKASSDSGSRAHDSRQILSGLPPKPDHATKRQRLNVRRDRTNNTCSEDNRPHLCEDEV